MPGVAGRDARLRVLEHGGVRGADAQVLGGGQEGVRGRFALQVPLLGHDAVDTRVEQVRDPGGVEHVGRVGAGGDDGGPQARGPHRLDVPDRAVVDLHAVRTDLLEDQIVLLVAQPVDRGAARLVVGAAFWQVDAPRLEEGLRTVQPGLAVHVIVVVVAGVERNELLTGLLGPLAQVAVEHLLPRCRVDQRRLRNDTIHVEKTG